MGQHDFQCCIWDPKPFLSSVKRMYRHFTSIISAKFCISKFLCEFQVQVSLYTLGTFNDNNWIWPPLWLKARLQTEQKLRKSWRVLGPMPTEIPHRTRCTLFWMSPGKYCSPLLSCHLLFFFSLMGTPKIPITVVSRAPYRYYQRQERWFDCELSEASFLCA